MVESDLAYITLFLILLLHSSSTPALRQNLATLGKKVLTYHVNPCAFRELEDEITKRR
jgi:hypothetical protein